MKYLILAWGWWLCLLFDVRFAWDTRKLFRWEPVGKHDLDGYRTHDGTPLQYRMRIGYIPWLRRARFRVASQSMHGTHFEFPGRLEWHPLRVAIHKIERPDNLRYGLHDHPWDFWSIVLWGAYFERYLDDDRPIRGGWAHRRTRIRKWLSCAWHPCTYQHAIIDVEGPCWTLIVTSDRKHAWGFPSRGMVIR